jgi:hypothetical protein
MKLLDFLKAKVFTQVTQCPICGEENGYVLNCYFNSYDGPCNLLINCKGCFNQIMLDGTLVREAIGLTRDDMNEQYYQIYYNNPSPYDTTPSPTPQNPQSTTP